MQRARLAQYFPQNEPVRCNAFPLRAGDAGIVKTIAFMRRLVAGPEGARHPQVRTLALAIVRDVASRDTAGERNAIFDWVKGNIKFRGERGETLQSPYVTLKLGAGDCDDFSTLLASLLESIGHTTAFKTVALKGNEFSHVYLLARDRATGKWVPLDATVSYAGPGWEPPGIMRERIWPTLGAGADALGDDTGFTLGPKAATAIAIIDRLSPLTSALAQRIAYGGGAGKYPFQQSFGGASVRYDGVAGNLTANSITAGNGWIYLAGGGVGLLALLIFMGRR